MNKLETARASLSSHRRWAKWELNAGAGRHCLIGAAYKVSVKGSVSASEVNTDPDITILADVIKEQYPERVRTRDLNFNVLTAFNDSKYTKFTDIDRVLDKAVVKSRELV